MPTRCEIPAYWKNRIGRAVCVGIYLLLLVAGAGECLGQISPGPLSASHASLEGATNCTQCHRPGSNASFKCLDCHSEIASRIAAGRGYHASVVKKDSGSQTCATCHSEHNGVAFRLIHWQPSQQEFDHSKAGWTLDGKHGGLTCNKCHNPSHVPEAEKTNIRVKDLNRTFLGLSKRCITCHVDEHRGQLGQNCQQCHNTSDWKKTSNFDHSRTRFALTGEHAKVACEKCHLPSGTDQKPKWAGLNFETCESCHRDPHRGTFSARCDTCHNTITWRSVSVVALNSRFDHSKTKFPLLGRHTQITCSKCHASGDFRRPIAFEKCSSCHRPDPHSGQFAQRADGGECSSCHTVEGWKPAEFGVTEHAKTAYPLEGKHALLQCAKCHIPAGRATLFKIKFARCTDCHRDAHAGQFKNAPLLNRCDLCHTVRGFRPSTFTLVQHQDTKFPLLGAHIAVACGDCHKKGSDADLGDVAVFRFRDMSCTGCHLDPHRGQFAERMAHLGSDGKPLGCLACHRLDSWKDLTKFDHSTTKFALLGTHRAVACADCHKPPNLEINLIHVDFRLAPHDCEGCHADPHAGQFLENGITIRCASCHNSNKWRPSIFDHNTRTAFTLKGVHANIACSKCHMNVQSVAGKSVLFFKPTPKECAACHGPEVLQRPNKL